MTFILTMPQLGLTMTEGTVGSWLKRPGDLVKKDELVLSISTDKVDMDIESPVDGLLREILVDQGQTVPVGAALAHIEIGEDESSPRPIPASAISQQEDPAAAPSARVNDQSDFETEPDRDAPAPQRDRLRASPRARRQADKLGVDIANLTGSGPSGRVIESDLLHALPGQPAPALKKPETKWRQVLADRMVESVRTIPAFSLSLEVNAEELSRLYQDLRHAAHAEMQPKLTYTDMLLRVLALSLAKTPDMNAVWDAKAVQPRNRIDLGFAVATERGVVAPVLGDLATVSLKEVSLRRAALTDKARQNSLSFADVEGAVGTLSNLGMYRIDRFEGIITPKQSFILTAGKLRDRPWVDVSLVVKPTVILNLTVDHRMTDGASAAVFLENIANFIESPDRLVTND